MNPTTFRDSRLHVFTDVPTDVRMVEQGIEVGAPCNATMIWRTASMSLPEQDTPLSIRCAFGGVRMYEVDGRPLAVDDKSYLILNCGQRFASRVESEKEIESFHVCFWPDFVQDVLRGLVVDTDRLLDEPESGGQPVQFFERLYPHDDLLSPVLNQIRHSIHEPWVTHGWLEEQNHKLLEQMLCVHRRIAREIELMPAARQATRIELYRRLCRAKDYMDSCYSESLTIRKVAEVAWFSPHHFLRYFGKVYGVTPHQYLTRQRLERAKDLLATTDMPVLAVCQAVGFESRGSFASLFRKLYGVAPAAYRSRSRIPDSNRH